MTHQATGTFEVKLSPQALVEGVDDPSVTRIALDKRFAGDLAGTSRGQMLAAQTATQGSAGYVAIERVVGTLGGRTGTFALQHFGVMDRGRPTLTITVVPDSGTGELVGLAGSMVIEVSGGQHSYHFDYSLTDPTDRA